MRASGSRQSSQTFLILNMVKKYQVPSAEAHFVSWKGEEKASPLSKYARPTVPAQGLSIHTIHLHQ